MNRWWSALLVLLPSIIPATSLHAQDVQFAAGETTSSPAAGQSRLEYSAIIGRVNRPGVYLWRRGEAGLVRWIERAGGFSAGATGNIRVVRNGHSGSQAFLDPRKLDGNQSTIEIQPGDVIVVDGSVTEPYQPAGSSAEARSRVQGVGALQTVAIVNLIDRPVVVPAVGQTGSVRQLLTMLGQSQAIDASRLVSSPYVMFQRRQSTVPTEDQKLVAGDVLVLMPGTSIPGRIPVRLPEPINEQPVTHQKPAGLTELLPGPVAADHGLAQPTPVDDQSSISDSGARSDSTEDALTNRGLTPVLPLPAVVPPILDTASRPASDPETAPSDDIADDGFRAAADGNDFTGQEPLVGSNESHLTSDPRTAERTFTTPAAQRLVPDRGANGQRTAVEPMPGMSASTAVVQDKPVAAVVDLTSTEPTADELDSVTDSLLEDVDQVRQAGNENDQMLFYAIAYAALIAFGIGVRVVWQMVRLEPDTSHRAVAPQPAPLNLLEELIQNRLPIDEEPLRFPDQMQFYGRSSSAEPVRLESSHELAGPHFAGIAGSRGRSATTPQATESESVPSAAQLRIQRRLEAFTRTESSGAESTSRGLRQSSLPTGSVSQAEPVDEARSPAPQPDSKAKPAPPQSGEARDRSFLYHASHLEQPVTRVAGDRSQPPVTRAAPDTGKPAAGPVAGRDDASNPTGTPAGGRRIVIHQQAAAEPAHSMRTPRKPVRASAASSTPVTTPAATGQGSADRSPGGRELAEQRVAERVAERIAEQRRGTQSGATDQKLKSDGLLDRILIAVQQERRS